MHILSNKINNLVEAEIAANELECDTLIYVTEKDTFCGSGKKGIWSIGIPNNLVRIMNAIIYEESNKRKVALWSKDKVINRIILKEMNKTQKYPIFVIEDEFLCHSTSIENFIDILKDNKIKSLKVLLSEGKKIKTIRTVLNEPEESIECVDFCLQRSISSEIVVASRQIDNIFNKNYIEYYPGVRMYMYSQKADKLQNKVIDGLHDFRVKNYIDLDNIDYIILPNKKSYECCIKYINKKIKEKIVILSIEDKITPEEYIEQANNIVNKKFRKY